MDCHGFLIMGEDELAPEEGKVARVASIMVVRQPNSVGASFLGSFYSQDGRVVLFPGAYTLEAYI
jgi:hypothetical protein